LLDIAMPNREAKVKAAAGVIEDVADRKLMGLIAHELRNPLMPLRDAGLALRCMAAGDPRTTRALAVIQRQVQVITNLVQTLVEISALNGHAVKANPNTSLERACLAALEAVTEQARQNDIHIDMTRPLPDASVAFESRTLERIIAILLGNAVSQTAPGGAITCAVRLVGKTAIIEVAEHNRGVSATELTSLFRLHGPTTGVPDSMHGVRLALYLAKRLTERYGGILQCHSEGLGTGSTLELRVPLVKGLRGPRTKPTRRRAVCAAVPINAQIGLASASSGASGLPAGVAIDRRGPLRVAKGVGNVVWRASMRAP
jgi:signal transduction histidine kinase